MIKNPEISSMALIEPGAVIGENCTIGAFSIVRSGVKLGDGSIVGSHCDLGISSPLSKNNLLDLGKGAHIRSHSRMYLGSQFGEGLVTGHGVTVRENSLIGDHVQLGTLSDIQGDCEIGDYSRLHSNVHIGKGSQIGKFVWLYPYVVLTNDPTPPSNLEVGVLISDFVVIATMSTILPGVKVGFGSFLGSNSLLNKNLPAEMIAVGAPARVIKKVSEIKSPDGESSHYPWPLNFSRGYPENLMEVYFELKALYFTKGQP